MVRLRTEGAPSNNIGQSRLILPVLLAFGETRNHKGSLVIHPRMLREMYGKVPLTADRGGVGEAEAGIEMALGVAMDIRGPRLSER
jgi:hypothetical protein